MPYQIFMNGPEGKEHCVYKVNEDDEPIGESLGCHATHEQAEEQVGALYANEDMPMKFYRFEAVKAITEGDEWVLEVLGAPYYGPNGKDRDGEYFSSKTDFMVGIGDRRPAVYLHGFTPDIKPEQKPEAIGVAEVSGRDDKGLWFKVVLNKANAYAQRLWDAAKRGLVRASSGAINYLIRIAEDGEILTWPIGELSLLDLGGGRIPANDYAVALPLKSHFSEVDLEMPQAFSQGHIPEAESGDPEILQIENIFDKKSNLEPEMGMEEIPMDTNDRQALVADVLAALEAKDAERKVEADRVEALKATIREEVQAELEAKIPAWKGGFNIKQVTDLGLKNDAKASFIHWIRTGDEGAAKAALQEGTNNEGGFLVPDDFYAGIVERRDEISWPRRAGVQVFTTSRDVLNIPVQATGTSTFTLTAEEDAVNEKETYFGQEAITVYKFTRMMKVSNELLDDNAANLEAYLTRLLARSMALTENYYVSVGSGSSQPEGVMVGGTSALTFDASLAITSAEVPELEYKLSSPYRPGAIWLTHDATLAHLRSKQSTNNWDLGPIAIVVDGAGVSMDGYPVYTDSNVSQMASGTASLLFGNMEYYALVEHSGLTVVRNPYLYQANDQLGLFAKFRFGGAVLQSEAFAIGHQL